MDEQAGLQEHQRTASVPPNPPPTPRRRSTQPPTPELGVSQGHRQSGRDCRTESAASNRGHMHCLRSDTISSSAPCQWQGTSVSRSRCHTVLESGEVAHSAGQSGKASGRIRAGLDRI
ncbi:hypothetical protein Q5P01_006591 [Channa striata]|uniref:Uncharacterized protein n=1 Tax=Channa striata TaxID=64152 RepID=A0AA88N9A2_CHASR|nr:hypothetical protein Q5P01_006591 [Channa striata]